MEEEEREAISSFYTLPGESDISGNVIAVNLSINLGSTVNDGSDNHPVIPVRVLLSLTKDYPETLPDISIISEHMNRNQTNQLKSKVIQRSHDLLGYPMILSVLSLIEECLQEEQGSVAMCTGTNLIHGTHKLDKEQIWTSVLHIDHMRSKNKYCKTLEKWCSELCLNGRLYFCHRLILVLLQGEIENIKDFIVRLKTTSVDVDSKGHSCKERMMKPLSEEEIPTDDQCRFKAFKRCEVSSQKELEQEFIDAGLSQMYQSILPTIKGYL